MGRETAYDTPVPPAPGLGHDYGPQVHVLADPYALARLARLCSPEVVQPEFNGIVRELYQHLLVNALNRSFPTERIDSATRMAASHRGGVFSGTVIDRGTKVVCVDVARAGMLPSQVCFDLCNSLFDPAGVRQDHLIMSRVTDADGRVVGADISGSKIGGPIDDRYVLFPDPMGATGGSLAAAISLYKRDYGERPAAIITLNLIVTPEFVRAVTTTHPDVQIYALRVDRGASPDEVLRERLGARWDEESGLTDIHYIVPGGGGFGELMNNSWV